MNEELQKALSELLGKANYGIDAASGFLAAELPEVIQQLLMWYGVRSFIICFIGIVAAIALPKMISAMLRKPEEGVSNFFWNSNGDFSDKMPPVMFVVFGGLFALIIECVLVFDFINIEWLQIWITPKLWLIEYAAKLAS